jgi:hypothetical protein
MVGGTRARSRSVVVIRTVKLPGRIHFFVAPAQLLLKCALLRVNLHLDFHPIEGLLLTLELRFLTLALRMGFHHPINHATGLGTRR